MFLPRDPTSILDLLKKFSNDHAMKFTAQEIGMYERIISTLKPTSPEQEEKLVQAYKLVLDHSKPVVGKTGL